MKCERCHEHIPADADDHYNSEHTEINCPSCGLWQDPWSSGVSRLDVSRPSERGEMSQPEREKADGLAGSTK